MENIKLWDVKFLDCCLAAPVCMLACMCPAVVQSMSFYKREQKNSCLRCLFGQSCCCIGLSLNREKIREFYDIKGSACMECLLYTCICCCCHAYLSTQEFRQASINL